jgi:hypothetical protein
MPDIKEIASTPIFKWSIVIKLSASQYSNAKSNFQTLRRGADMSSALPISYFPICSTAKNLFLDGLKKLELRSHKCVELRGEYVE